MRAHLEDNEAMALIRWRDLHARKHPELGLLYHCPNGGFRNAREGARLKRMGVQAGIPDYCLPVARMPYHGAYFELKAKDGRMTDTQFEWLIALIAQDYWAQVVYGWVEAAKAICSYLGIEGISP